MRKKGEALGNGSRKSGIHHRKQYILNDGDNWVSDVSGVQLEW